MTVNRRQSPHERKYAALGYRYYADGWGKFEKLFEFWSHEDGREAFDIAKSLEGGRPGLTPGKTEDVKQVNVV